MQRVLRKMRQHFMPEIWDLFSPNFSLLLILLTWYILHPPSSSCSCFTLFLLVLPPFPSGKQPLWTCWGMCFSWVGVVLKIGFLLSIFLLLSSPHACCILACLLLFLALIEVPVRNKWCLYWVQMGNTEKTKKVIKILERKIKHFYFHKKWIFEWI